MTYDLEDDIGLTAEDSTPFVAARNTQLLNAALDAQWAGGNFKFRNGKSGPVLHPIGAAGREFFYEGPIKTSLRQGCAIHGAGGRATPLPSSSYNSSYGTGGLVTRFTRIDSDKGGAVLLLRGTSANISGIEFRGVNWANAEFNTKAIKATAGIEIEGRSIVCSGWHTLRDVGFSGCKYGIVARGGYYDDAGKFVTDENHAEQCTVDGAVFYACDSCWRTENQQAVNWSFKDLICGSPTATTIFDCERPTAITATNVSINTAQSTLIRITNGYSPFCNTIVANDVKWDRGMGVPGGFCKLLRYDGPDDPGYDLNDAKWRIRVTGHVSGFDEWLTTPADFSKFIDIPSNGKKLPLNNIHLDIEGLQYMPTGKGKFEPVINGPWQRPTSEWIK